MILCKKKFQIDQLLDLAELLIYPIGRRLFQISGKTESRIRNFFSLKPPCGQDGANKKKFSQIGPAVPEFLRDTQTDTKALITLKY